MCCVLETRLRVYKGNYTHKNNNNNNNNELPEYKKNNNNNDDLPHTTITGNCTRSM